MDEGAGTEIDDLHQGGRAGAGATAPGGGDDRQVLARVDGVPGLFRVLRFAVAEGPVLLAYFDEIDKNILTTQLQA
jgi:hypothetical protein